MSDDDKRIIAKIAATLEGNPAEVAKWMPRPSSRSCCPQCGAPLTEKGNCLRSVALAAACARPVGTTPTPDVDDLIDREPIPDPFTIATPSAGPTTSRRAFGSEHHF